VIHQDRPDALLEKLNAFGVISRQCGTSDGDKRDQSGQPAA
jgi:hypothetical protein